MRSIHMDIFILRIHSEALHFSFLAKDERMNAGAMNTLCEYYV